MTILVEGKKIAEKIKAEIKQSLKDSEPKSLAIFYIGENNVIDSYVKLKQKVGESLGVDVSVFRFNENISEEFLIKEIKKANNKFSGIIVQLPLPRAFNRAKILDAIGSSVDVDLLSTVAYDNFKNNLTKRLPPVVASIKEIINEYKIDLSNKKIGVVGQGILVGRPICDWLKQKSYDYLIFDDQTKNLGDKLKDMDVIISGVGVSSLITPDMIKNGVILIDVGTSNSNGKLVGDIDKSCYDKSAIVSGVPGGVGPITVVSLFKNIFLK
jgi:methylenetetrahydrofolate dehydrogenase (NADP+)/methenyltetrahydrofolate cyclohydrolase